MKPIEKGCLALIVKSIRGNEGKTVIVGDYFGNLGEYIDLWKVSDGYYRPEAWMIRIDDYQEETKQELEVEV